MPGPGEFNPPATPADGEGYTFGGVEWKFDAQFGVWNIAEGTIIGGIGPPGPVGPAGPPGAGGPPGPAAVGGVTGIGFGDDIGLTGKINLTAASNSGISISQSSRTITFSNTGITGVRAKNASAAGDFIHTGLLTITGGNAVSVLSTSTGIINIDLKSGVTGDTVVAGYGIDVVADGKTKTINNTGVTSFNGLTGSIVAGQTGRVVFRHTSGQLTGSTEFQYDGLGLTYTSSRIRIANTNLNLTVTGPNITLGQQTQITGGIFTNPAEKCASFVVTADDLVINGASGSIQRFTVTPSNRVTIKAGTGWNTTTDGATETIAVIVKWGGGYLTGSFDNTIISGNPVLFGVTGGIEMFTLMRVNMAGAGLTMGLPIANGLTGRNYNWT
jgi:hypothetical protein